MKPLISEESTIPQTAVDKDIWTAEEVAEYLRCTARHVTNLATRGEIPGKKFGTIWRFKRQDIVAFR